MRGFEQRRGRWIRFDRVSRQRPARRPLRLEGLEERHLLSATALLDMLPQAHVSSTPVGLSPSQIKTAYSFPPSATGTADGTGQTIAIVDAYNDPDIFSDLAAFSTKEGITGTGSLTVVNQNGVTINPAAKSASVPPTDSGWALEIALDVEWAHAIAPGASIVLVEANSANLSDLMTAVNTARNLPNVSVVSMSWGEQENLSDEVQYDPELTTPAGHTGVTFVAASGDDGSPALWPATSGNVLAVGGTTLTVTNAEGSYGSETAWSDSGGGTSSTELEPSYQTTLQDTGRRTAPDVSYDANPATGVAVYDTVASGGTSGWQQVGGTSDAAPQWSAIVAIADQSRVADGSTPLSQGQAAVDSLPQADFHDITTGSNGGYSATKGYDEVTGLGTPVASSVIRDLTTSTVTYTPPAVTTISSSTGGNTGSGGTGGGGNGGHHHTTGHGDGGSGGFFGSFGFGFLVETSSGPESSAPASTGASVGVLAASQATGQSGTLSFNPLINGSVVVNSSAGASSTATTNPLLVDSTTSAFPARPLAGGLAAIAAQAANAGNDLSATAGRISTSPGLLGSSSLGSDQPGFAPLNFHYRFNSSLTANHNGPVFRYTAADVGNNLEADPGLAGPAALTAALWEALAPTLDFSPGAILEDTPLLAEAESATDGGGLEFAAPVALILAGLAAGWAHSTLEGRAAVAGQKRAVECLAALRERRPR